MTRFQMELSGALGEFWKKEAESELNKVYADYMMGDITIVDGVAYNKIGRPVMEDMAEKIELAGLPIDRVATKKANDEYSSKVIAEYKKSMENHVYSDEELFEMRAAFGKGTVIVDAFTGKKIRL